jgi:transcriptional regulator with XRE-family HTH domain
MTISEQAELIRNRMIGVLLRQARLEANKSVDRCAEALDRDPAFVTQAEEGRQALTLPQLETLADLFKVPVSRLIDDQQPVGAQPAAEMPPYEKIRLFRRKIIGVTLRQARLEAGQSLEDLAAELEMLPEDLDRIELGEVQLPFVKLRTWAELLDIPFEKLSPGKPASPTPKQPSGNGDALEHLPPDVRDFVLQPINIPYLQIAAKLSQMPADTLRQVASGLLEITY